MLCLADNSVILYTVYIGQTSPSQFRCPMYTFHLDKLLAGRSQLGSNAQMGK